MLLRRQLLRTSRAVRPFLLASRQSPRIQTFSTSVSRLTDDSPASSESPPDPRDQQIADIKEKFEKSQTDFQRLQEQSKREVAAAKSFAIQKFARDLLETIDNMARAASTISAEVKEDAERHKPFADLLHELGKAEGQLLGTLLSHGMKVVDPTGEKFDPNLHEATFEMAFPGKEPGTVFHVEQKGYTLNGRVLRPAKACSHATTC